MNNNKPNFFIVGAPKCGTTALATYLNENDEIYISNPKEPHYFATDFPKYRCCSNKNQYFDIFSDAKDDVKAIGEASVFYLYSKEAIKNIYEYNSESKLIVMIRNPVEMVYSLHSQLFYTADENVESFEKAWNLEKDRKNGENIPIQCREPKLLYYSEIAKYDEQIENIYTYFPKSQVKIILFDDFKKDTTSVYKDVLKFLNIRYDGKTEFKKVNENKKVKSKFLNKLIVRPPRLIGDIVRYIKVLFGIKKFGILDKIRQKNTNIVKREKLSKDFADFVYANYEDSITNLARNIGRELNGWKIGNEI